MKKRKKGGTGTRKYVYAHNNKQWPTTRQKCRTHKCAAPFSFFFFFSPRIPRMQRAARRSTGEGRPLEMMASAKEKKGESISRRDMRTTLFIPPPLIREGTHETSHPPFFVSLRLVPLHPLFSVLTLYLGSNICTYVYIYFSIYSRQEFRNHPDPEIQKLSETFYSSLFFLLYDRTCYPLSYSGTNFREL